MKKIFLIYLSVAVFFSIFYFLSFRLPLFTSQKVLFYRGVMLLALTSLITLIGISLYIYRYRKHAESLMAALIICFAIHLSFFVVFPVTFERSVTMFILSALHDGSGSMCNGLTKSEIQSELIDAYIMKRDAVEKRIKEQSAINMVNRKSECVTLTQKGINFLKFAGYVGKLYNY